MQDGLLSLDRPIYRCSVQEGKVHEGLHRMINVKGLKMKVKKATLTV